MNPEILPLWNLFEACRLDDAEKQHEAAAEFAAWCRQVDGEHDFAMQAGIFCAGGMPVVSGADTFAATHGVIEVLRDAEVASIRFASDVEAEALRTWAQHLTAGDRCVIAIPGVTMRYQGDAALSDAGDGAAPGEALIVGDSRLRSMFLQHRLIAGLPSIPGVDPAVGKLVVQNIADRLLSVPGGLEPLMLLQQDEGLLRRSTAVAVLATLLARRAGWSPELLADVGSAALLHDIGSILDPARPGPAGFRWLLQRGDSDFWLRSALVARGWSTDADGGGDVGPLIAVPLVRLAVAAYERGRFDASLREGLAQDVPSELLDIAEHTLAGC